MTSLTINCSAADPLFFRICLLGVLLFTLHHSALKLEVLGTTLMPLDTFHLHKSTWKLKTFGWTGFPHTMENSSNLIWKGDEVQHPAMTPSLSLPQEQRQAHQRVVEKQTKDTGRKGIWFYWTMKSQLLYQGLHVHYSFIPHPNSGTRAQTKTQVGQRYQARIKPKSAWPCTEPCPTCKMWRIMQTLFWNWIYPHINKCSISPLGNLNVLKLGHGAGAQWWIEDRETETGWLDSVSGPSSISNPVKKCISLFYSIRPLCIILEEKAPGQSKQYYIPEDMFSQS